MVHGQPPLRWLPNIADMNDSSAGPTTHSKPTKCSVLTNAQMCTINIHCHRLLTVSAVDYRSLVLTEVEDRLSLHAGYDRLASLHHEEVERRLVHDGSNGLNNKPATSSGQEDGVTAQQPLLLGSKVSQLVRFNGMISGSSL